ncbi:MAG: nuclease [Sphingobium sp.]
MAHNLYDLGDQPSTTPDRWLRERTERRRHIVPRGALLVALILGGGGFLLFKDILPDPRAAKAASAITIVDSFRACDDPTGTACALSADRYAWRGRSYAIGDIRGPSLTSPSCEQEGELAKQGRAALLALMNGGAFEARPDPDNTNARLLVRDGVSLGSLLVIRGFAVPAGAGKTDWCADRG